MKSARGDRYRLESNKSSGRRRGKAKREESSEETAECEVNICIPTLDEWTSPVGRKKRSRKQENDARRPSVGDRGGVDGKDDSTTGGEEHLASIGRGRS